MPNNFTDESLREEIKKLSFYQHLTTSATSDLEFFIVTMMNSYKQMLREEIEKKREIDDSPDYHLGLSMALNLIK